MITEYDLKEAIAECQGKRNPDASTCVKLAAYYTIMDHMEKKDTNTVASYSFASSNDADIIGYDSGTEFSEAIHGRSMKEILPTIDELMSTLQVVNPRLYNSVMQKL